jgi:hypothetical protein
LREKGGRERFTGREREKDGIKRRKWEAELEKAGEDGEGEEGRWGY